MYILDTDHLSLIQRNGGDGKRILARLAAVKDPEVAVTIITYEEQVRGRLNFLSKARTTKICEYCEKTLPSLQCPEILVDLTKLYS